MKGHMLWTSLKHRAGFVLLLVATASHAAAQTPLDTLQRLRASYPTPLSSAQTGELLNRVAWEYRFEGFGLLRKTTGHMCMAPGGLPIACDILTQRLPSGMITHFDVLIDSDGAATPGWSELGLVDVDRFVAPTNPLNGPIPTPLPGPTQADLAPLEIQITRLIDDVHMMTVAVNEQFLGVHVTLSELQGTVRAVEDQLTKMAATPLPAFPLYRGRVLGFPVVLHPVP